MIISLTYVIVSRVQNQLVTEQRAGWGYQAPKCAQCGIFRAIAGIKQAYLLPSQAYLVPFYVKSLTQVLPTLPRWPTAVQFLLAFAQKQAMSNIILN